MADFSSTGDLLRHIGLPPDAPWSIYPSAGEDTHPLVYLGPGAIARKATAGCEALGLPLPPAPRLQVMIDVNRDPMRPLAYEDELSVVEVIEGPDAVVLGGMPGSLSRVRFTSSIPAWEPEEVHVLRLKTSNEQFAAHVVSEGLRPEMLIGVTDGCRTIGAPSAECVNRLDPAGASAASAAVVSEWWVTDHFADSTPRSGLQIGTVVVSEHQGFPFQFRAVANLSGEWGTYAGWGFGGTWLFRVEPTS